MKLFHLRSRSDRIFQRFLSLNQETQEVVDLCFKHGIYPDCKVVEAKDIDWAWNQLIETNADGIRYGNRFLFTIFSDVFF